MIPHRRRGACPSLATPMPTGDGLLARLNLGGQTIPLDAATTLCEAARRHGSGIIEVTSRGSVQVRGLTPQSAPAFIDAVAEIDISVPDGVPIAVNPLAGLAADETVDAGALAHDLREAIRRAGLNGRLAPKVAVAIDSGSALHLDALAADLRLRAEAKPGGAQVDLALGGNAESATTVGTVAVDHATEAAVRLLGELAARGEQARAREVVRLVGVAPFRAGLADLLTNGAAGTADATGAGPAESPGAVLSPPRRPRAEPIGIHGLHDGRVAIGTGLPFGVTDVDALLRLIEAARRMHAVGLRAAPDRVLLVIGIAPEDAGALAAQAAALGFITRADDPRRAMAVCPGAPFCACTDVPMRALAPAVAVVAAALFDGSLQVHFSGCAKGCAHPGRTALTVVGDDGRCAVVVNGSARDRPVVVLEPDMLPAGLARLAETCAGERLPGEGTAAVLSRLGPARIAAILAGTPA